MKLSYRGVSYDYEPLGSVCKVHFVKNFYKKLTFAQKRRRNSE